MQQETFFYFLLASMNLLSFETMTSPSIPLLLEEIVPIEL